MKILGIETSCDETAAALVEARNNHFYVRSHIVASQILVHQKYGGVVPEVAARNHAEHIISVIRRAAVKQRPDVIAVTAGPGLATALLVGVESARALSYAWKTPIIRVNHIEGHLYANWLTLHHLNDIQFPALVLIISGGHTELILMKNHGRYFLLGKTLDDAAGECFDKVGKMLGISYPAGARIGELARLGKRDAIIFPRPMIEHKNYSFSFSGLKTSALYWLEKYALAVTQNKNNKQHIAAKFRRFNAATWPSLPASSATINGFCASLEQAITDVLIHKTIRAAQEYKAKSVLIGGGVAANTFIRSSLAHTLNVECPRAAYIQPALKFCTDNAAMIAAAGYFKALQKQYTPWQKLAIDPEWEIAI